MITVIYRARRPSVTDLYAVKKGPSIAVGSKQGEGGWGMGGGDW